MQKMSGRSQNVSPPSAVAGASSRPRTGMSCASAQASTAASSPRRVGLPERSAISAAVGHQGRVERVDEVGAGCLGLELVDGDTKSGQDGAEGVVLAAGLGQVDRVQESVSGVFVRAAERLARALHQHLMERGGHALGAEAARLRCCGLCHVSQTRWSDPGQRAPGRHFGVCSV